MQLTSAFCIACYLNAQLCAVARQSSPRLAVYAFGNQRRKFLVLTFNDRQSYILFTISPHFFYDKSCGIAINYVSQILEND